MHQKQRSLVGTHWGNYEVDTLDDTVVDVQPSQTDSNPSSIGELIYDIQDTNYRIRQPMIRAGFFRGDNNHQQNRGKDAFIPVSWDEALDLVARELKRVISNTGNKSIYGGSYGWSSAGRFHHAQSQLHRFLNTIGGYTASVNSYSFAAAEVIVPHIIGIDLPSATEQLVKYDDIATACDLLIAFGGIGDHNHQVVAGGIGDHQDKHSIQQLAKSGTEIISISPINSDTPDYVPFEWMTVRPCTDVAIMVGIAYELETNGDVDVDFVQRYTVGYDRLKSYLLGEADGIVKDATWAARIADIYPNDIKDLATKLKRADCPLITVSGSLQRAEHGEQPYWMAIALSAMLGSFGKDGGGVGLTWGTSAGIYHKVPFKWGKLPQGRNPISDIIPVARITEMLFNPGKTYMYDGKTRTYPDIQLIYWAGGNPFHHHQDLNQLRQAWQKPETIIVNEPYWTATARHADIVFPVKTFMERNDIVCGKDTYISPSKKTVDGYDDHVLSDYEIFCGLADRFDVLDIFSEGKGEMEWLETIYEDSKRNAKEQGIELPSFVEFWQAEKPINIESQLTKQSTFLDKFMENPEDCALPTPSGKIELFSDTIDSFSYSDCTGHPRWFEKREWLGSPRAGLFPLHMISRQPRNKLHSQLDFGEFSRKDKTKGREMVTLHPDDADARGIEHEMIVRIFNDRGACLASASVSRDIMQGVISLPTGAWYCPDNESDNEILEYHGNPNVLTMDVGTSSLAQGPSAHSCLVEIEPFKGAVKNVSELLKPAIISRTDL